MTEKSLKTIVNTLLITATIDKEAAVAAVKTLNNFDNKSKVKENIPTQRPDYSDKPLTDVLQLTDIARVARQGSFMRSLARRSSRQVDEGQVLERVRALEPNQVQAMLERRGARVAISMAWVVRLCMVERGEAGLQEGRDTGCYCGKVFKEISSSVTHQQWCIVADGKKRTGPDKLEANVTAKRRRNKGEKVDKKRNLNQNKYHTKANLEMPRKALHQNLKVHLKEKVVTMEQGVRVITLLPSLSPSLPSLPPATISDLQSLALLTPRLLQGTMSLQKVGRQTGLQEEVVRAWRDSIRICLPDSRGKVHYDNKEI